MAINHKPHFSPTLYTNLQGYTKFKADLHQVSIKVRKDPTQKWHDFPYLAMDDVIDVVLDQWLTEWRTITDLVVGRSKSAMQKKKEEAKLKMAQLAEKRKKEVVDKGQVEHKAAQQRGKQIGGTEQGSDKGARLPSPETKEETEQQNANPQETSAHIKCPRELEKGGPRKKSKKTKTLLDPITLIEGDMHDISDIVWGVTA